MGSCVLGGGRDWEKGGEGATGKKWKEPQEKSGGEGDPGKVKVKVPRAQWEWAV